MRSQFTFAFASVFSLVLWIDGDPDSSHLIDNSVKAFNITLVKDVEVSFSNALSITNITLDPLQSAFVVKC